MLGDYGVLAEVHCYQWCEAECQWLHVRQRVTKQKREEAEKEERAIGWELRVLEVAKNEVEERLTKARVRGQVASLFEEGEDLTETLGNNEQWLNSLLANSQNLGLPLLNPSPPSIHLAERIQGGAGSSGPSSDSSSPSSTTSSATTSYFTAEEHLPPRLIVERVDLSNNPNVIPSLTGVPTPRDGEGNPVVTLIASLIFPPKRNIPESALQNQWGRCVDPGT